MTTIPSASRVNKIRSTLRRLHRRQNNNMISFLFVLKYPPSNFIFNRAYGCVVDTCAECTIWRLLKSLIYTSIKASNRAVGTGCDISRSSYFILVITYNICYTHNIQCNSIIIYLLLKYILLLVPETYKGKWELMKRENHLYIF